LANDSGLPYNPDTISKLWRDFLSRHPDIRPLNLHALRHSQMCAMIELGIAPAVAAARLGDTVATAMTAYSHSSRPKEQAAAALLEKALSR
jgi:integrase